MSITSNSRCARVVRMPASGVTLVEIVCATAMVGAMLLPALQMFSHAAMLAAHARQTAAATELLGRELARLQSARADSLTSGQRTDRVGSNDYRVQVTVSSSPPARLVDVRVEVSWDGVFGSRVTVGRRVLLVDPDP